MSARHDRDLSRRTLLTLGGAWMPHVKNFGPNIGHDDGGRLMAAWLDR